MHYRQCTSDGKGKTRRGMWMYLHIKHAPWDTANWNNDFTYYLLISTSIASSFRCDIALNFLQSSRDHFRSSNLIYVNSLGWNIVEMIRRNIHHKWSIAICRYVMSYEIHWKWVNNYKRPATMMSWRCFPLVTDAACVFRIIGNFPVHFFVFIM